MVGFLVRRFHARGRNPEVCKMSETEKGKQGPKIAGIFTNVRRPTCEIQMTQSVLAFLVGRPAGLQLSVGQVYFHRPGCLK